MRLFFPKSLLISFCALALSGALGCGGCDGQTTGNNSTRDASLGPDVDVTDASDANGGLDATGDDVGRDAQSCPTDLCGGECCAAGDECVEDQCLPACSGTRCGADQSLCCASSELCLGDQCVLPGEACERTEECPVDAICEPTVGRCVPRSAVEVCEFIPPVTDFEPNIGCSWPPPNLGVNSGRTHVVVAPVVGNLTDDNGDGLTNTDDIPDIAFLSRATDRCCNKPGTLRIVSGACNADGTMEEIASINGAQMVNDGALALGDLTGDGIPELAAISYNGPLGTNDRQNPQGVVVWTRVSDDGSQWEVLWRNTQYPTYDTHTINAPTISLADLEGDGQPEVVVGNVALNGQTGDLKWDGLQQSSDNVGIGNNAFVGPTNAIGDVDLDGKMEVAAGNTLYAHDGTIQWTFEYTSSNSGCQGALDCDGFTGLGNFDDDPEGEVVIVRRGEVFVLHHDGQLLWKQAIPIDDCMRNGQVANESGPPTVADFDGDGRPEIGTAAADFYTVLDLDCDQDPLPDGCQSRGVLWAVPNEDCSSRATASSVFDFEGDGKAEMVYADEDTFRVLDGTDGSPRFTDSSHSSNTRIEMPIVADVDNDGNAEIVVPSATGQGLKVWEDPNDNWVRTRRIWNQHAYSVTNITEDGRIPTYQAPNWRNGRLNNFRQNIQPGGVFDAPDLAVEEVGLGGACTGAEDVTITVTVANRGALGEPAGVPVRIFADHSSGTTELATLATATRLLPGQTETLTSPWTVPAGWWQDGFTLRATIDPDGNVNECDEGNNGLSRDSADLGTGQPGLEIAALDADDSLCGQTQSLPVSVTVENVGQDAIPAGTPVRLEAKLAGRAETIATLTTTTTLLAGETEQLDVDWAVPANWVGVPFEVEATVDPDGQVFDCAQNSSATTPATCVPEG